MPHWIVISAISGCAWGGLACLLMDSGHNAAVMGAVASAPVIGLGMGWVSRGFHSRPISHRWLVAVGTLYLAAALFGLVGGVVDALQRMQLASAGPSTPILTKALESMFVMVLGLTGSGYVLVLAPLAYANHLMVDAVAGD